eukprot:CAMPEP_0176092714 /NCGR_PEP_ID=MMETSP0120_2-20121206/46450_1 /TAXON_ID=160619 /ORGANISM="Kryptoperidinium foliaceum, Strain CCMP 1326" /LENGTH=190 /DNA_ID=CAMNT_0017426633 /DNA_START=54 /DNA_END=623 /DNA_ORIENTATION=+
MIFAVVLALCATGGLSQSFAAGDGLFDLGVYDASEVCEAKGEMLTSWRHEGALDVCDETQDCFCFVGTGIGVATQRATELCIKKNTGNVEVKVFEDKSTCDGVTPYTAKIKSDQLTDFMAGKCIKVESLITIFVVKEKDEEIKCLKERLEAIAAANDPSGGSAALGDFGSRVHTPMSCLVFFAVALARAW